MATSSRQRVIRIHGRLAQSGHHVPVRLWDGTELGPVDAGFRLVFPEPGSLRAMVVPPTDLVVGEAFLAGKFHVDGSMVAAVRAVANLRSDLPPAVLARVGWDVVRLPSSTAVGTAGDHRPATAGGRVHMSGRRHSKGRDRAAIVHHYDVGEDFFRLFLDEALVYSCAYFLDGDEDWKLPPDPSSKALDRAQTRKLDVVCRKLGLRPGMTMLDIGCGWGALVLHAARHYGIQAVGVTLSEDQVAVARRRVADAGLDGQVEIRRQDYRDIDDTFDAVASVGMVEHVGADHLAGYAEAVWERTAPGGRLLNHGITTGRSRKVRDMATGRGTSFVAEHVFPDGSLAPASHMLGVLQDAGWEMLDVEQLRPNYARTLQHWVARLEASQDAAHRLVDDAIHRTWRIYMAASAIGFESGDLGVMQVLAGRDSQRPLGRGWMVAADDVAAGRDRGLHTDHDARLSTRDRPCSK